MIGIQTVTGLQGLHGVWLAGIPVDPDAPEAQQWLRDELAKAPYQAAKPTWFDRVSKAFLDWINSLTAPTGDGFGNWIPVILTLVVIAVLVTAFLIFGMPRLNQRSQLPAELFGEDDRRSADDMRRAAAVAALGKDWSLAIEEAFRALARGLSERTILVVMPGTTAHDFAVRAADAFPAENTRLSEAAEVFDQVRYLELAGTERGYLTVAALESELRSAKPVGFEHPTPTAVL